MIYLWMYNKRNISNVNNITGVRHREQIQSNSQTMILGKWSHKICEIQSWPKSPNSTCSFKWSNSANDTYPSTIAYAELRKKNADFGKAIL